MKEVADIGSPRTIINLRIGADSNDFGVAHYHFPLANKYEKYHTEQKEVQNWLNAILKIFEQEELPYPVLIHCLSGKDRTGIVIAALLLVLGVQEEMIVKEYLLSEGEVSKELIGTAIQGITGQKSYFNRVDLEKVRRNLLKPMAV